MDLGAKMEWPVEVMAQTLGVRRRALVRWQERRQAPCPSCRRGRPSVIDPMVRLTIRQCYLQHFGQWGPRVLAQWCRREHIGHYSCGAIAEVIVDLRPQKEPQTPPVRYEATASNVMWSEDGTGFKQNGRKRELIVVQDEKSRKKMNWKLAPGPATSADVVQYLRLAFCEYGAPLVLKHDNDGIFHTPEVVSLLEQYEVLDLTSPPGTPRYNGKQERSMRDIKSYERAMRKNGVSGSLSDRIRATMQDLNEDRPRPVLGGLTACESYEEGLIALPTREELRTAVEKGERRILAQASSRVEVRSARRWAIEATLVSYGLVKIEGDVSHDFL
jgi:transposase InsO family protein